MEKKYRIINSFYYHGPDGKDKKGIFIGPGEIVPKLEPSQIEKFLKEEKICEIDEYGENIKCDKVHNLTDDQIHGLVSKGPNRIMQELNSGIMYSNETLAKLYREAERLKVSQAVLDAIEKKFTDK